MRKRIIAFVLSITCTVGITAIAASTLRTINVNYGINIEVNGKNQTLTDAGGNKVDPFVYNGTTFVPIRAISEIFGANVDYIPATNTATIDFSTYLTPGGKRYEKNKRSFTNNILL